MLVSRDEDGNVVHLLLVSPEGKPVNREILELIGEPVRVRGPVVQQGDQLVLRADPSTYFLVDLDLFRMFF